MDMLKVLGWLCIDLFIKISVFVYIHLTKKGYLVKDDDWRNWVLNEDVHDYGTRRGRDFRIENGGLLDKFFEGLRDCNWFKIGEFEVVDGVSWV